MADLHPAQEALADVGTRDTIITKADRGRRPETIQQTPDEYLRLSLRLYRCSYQLHMHKRTRSPYLTPMKRNCANRKAGNMVLTIVLGLSVGVVFLIVWLWKPVAGGVIAACAVVVLSLLFGIASFRAIRDSPWRAGLLILIVASAFVSTLSQVPKPSDQDRLRSFAEGMSLGLRRRLENLTAEERAALRADGLDVGPLEVTRTGDSIVIRAVRPGYTQKGDQYTSASISDRPLCDVLGMPMPSDRFVESPAPTCWSRVIWTAGLANGAKMPEYIYQRCGTRTVFMRGSVGGIAGEKQFENYARRCQVLGYRRCAFVFGAGHTMTSVDFLHFALVLHTSVIQKIGETSGRALGAEIVNLALYQVLDDQAHPRTLDRLKARSQPMPTWELELRSRMRYPWLFVSGSQLEREEKSDTGT